MFITALFTVPTFGNNPGALQLHVYTTEFYSAIKNNDMWFEGKWMQMEDIMLSDVSLAQKDKGCIFSLICGR
jgi:hypothetical protein